MQKFDVKINILIICQHVHHTIYKNHFVRGFWAVCGCVRVCDMSLEPSRPPDEDLISARLLARAWPAVRENAFFTT